MTSNSETLDRLQTRMVQPVGPLDAVCCLVGEAPGEEENSNGIPFSGAAGYLLNRSLADQGLIRSELLITNCFRQQPPRNDIGYYFEDAKQTKLTWEGREHIDILTQFLTRRRDTGALRILVALGATSLYILTGKKRITKWRGSLLPCSLVDGLVVYPTFHPSFVNRLLNEPREVLQGERKKLAQNALPTFLIDLGRVRSLIDGRVNKFPKRQLEIGYTFSRLQSELVELNNTALVSIDIETLPSPSGPLLWCIGFSPRPDYAFVVPFITNGKPCWPVPHEAELHRLISELFLNPKVRKVFHGGTYDLAILGRYFGHRCAPGTIDDTMWAHHSMHPYLSKALHYLTSIYTWEPYYKDEGRVNFNSRTDSGEFLYNAKDCAVTREIMPIVEKDCRELGTWNGYQSTMKRYPSLLDMMIRGIKVDVDKKARLIKRLRGLSDHYEAEVQAAAGVQFNPRSSKDKHRILYGLLALPIQHNHKTKQPTTDKDALNKLRRKFPDNTVLDYLLKFQRYDKLASTYAEMSLDVDNRARTHYRFVSTWRLSSSGSPFMDFSESKGEAAGNLQNIPKRGEDGSEIRSLFIPDTGFTLGSADLSQAEARVVAWEAEDIEEIELYLSGKFDVHWEKAKLVFGFPHDLAYEPNKMLLDPISKSEFPMKIFRDIGKTIVHASNYDMGPGMAQTILSRQNFFFELSTCRNIMQLYKSKKPALSEWKRKIREKVSATRKLISSYGRVRYFMGRLNDDLFRAAYAFSPQNTVGELLQDAIQDIFDKVPEVQILLNVHDEVVFQFKGNPEFVLPKVKACMERELVIHNRSLIIPADFKIGPNWGALKTFTL